MLNLRKIFNKNVLSIFIVAIVGAMIIAPISLLIYNSIANKRDFVLANYQSYMSPDVEQQLNEYYGVDFDYFESAENAKNMLVKNTADIVNTTSYELQNWVSEGLVCEIDWGNLVGDKIEGFTINNAQDALQLFIEPVQTILTSTDLDGDGVNDNLLQYAVPYFLQDLVFAYRGQEIDATNYDLTTWKGVLDMLQTEPRFAPIKNPQLIGLDDPRTMYSIPRSIQTNGDINPAHNATIDELQDTYRYLSNPLKKIADDAIIFNSDSSVVLNKLALNEVSGAFCFNGDAIYASMGGDEGTEIAEDDFHYIRPQNNLVALDMFVINKNIKPRYLNQAYSVLFDLCINETMAFENFDYVYYTPPLTSVYNQINEQELLPFQVDLLTNIDISDAKKQIEAPLDNITKSNFQFAWIGFKSWL